MSIPPFFNFHDMEIEHKIRTAKYNCSRKGLQLLKKDNIIIGAVDCILLEIRDRLIHKGIKPEMLEHNVNDFLEELKISMGNERIVLDIGLFPKRGSRKIRFTYGNGEIRSEIDKKATPDSVAQFILAFFKWLPEYLGIEEVIMAQEKQKRMACEIAFDLLSRTVKEALDKKGYIFSIRHNVYKEKADIAIFFSKSLTINLEVQLMREFLEDVLEVVNSLPDGNYGTGNDDKD